MLGISPEKSPFKALKNLLGLMFFLLCISLSLGGGFHKVFNYLSSNIQQYRQQNSVVKDPEVMKALFEFYQDNSQNQKKAEDQDLVNNDQEEPDEEYYPDGGFYVGGIKRY